MFRMCLMRKYLGTFPEPLQQNISLSFSRSSFENREGMFFFTESINNVVLPVVNRLRNLTKLKLHK